MSFKIVCQGGANLTPQECCALGEALGQDGVGGPGVREAPIALHSVLGIDSQLEHRQGSPRPVATS